MTPILETERLRLRPHVLADFPAIAALWGDPAVVRFIGGKPFTATECWSRLLRYRGHWELLGYGYWAVEEKSSGRFAGEVGFLDNKRDMSPSLGDAPEAGWVFAPWSQGRGFATEAMRAAQGWAEETLAAARTVCMIAPENIASLGVAAKLGYREFARATFRDEPMVLLENVRRQTR